MAEVARRTDPYLSFCFKIEVQNLVVAGFSEITGLGFETEVESFREGGLNQCERQLPGPTKHPSRLSLKRGVGDVDRLWSWYEDILSGSIQRRDISILLFDGAGNEKRRWNFRGACPVKWVGPDMKAGTAEVGFETVELVHRGYLK
ncbi:MAG: phage tail protein [Gammaproteobacteria bacterium]